MNKFNKNNNLNFIKCNDCGSNINTKYIKPTEFNYLYYENEVEFGHIYCPLCKGSIDFNTSIYPELIDLFSIDSKNQSEIDEDPFDIESLFGTENP